MSPTSFRRSPPAVFSATIAAFGFFTFFVIQLAKASNGKVQMGHLYPTQAPWLIGLAWASGGRFFKLQGDTWIQTLNNPAAEKVLTYWNDLIKKGYISTVPGFTAEYYTALGKGQIASSIEAAWGPGVTAASLNDKTAGEWSVWHPGRDRRSHLGLHVRPEPLSF